MTSKTLIQRDIADLANAEQAYSAGTADSPSLYLAAQAARQLLMQALTMLPGQDRRFEAAKAAMTGMLAAASDDATCGTYGGAKTASGLAELAVGCADALIAELAKEQK